MARTIGSYQTAPFTVPINGQPGDADQVRGNDNVVRASINSHDIDSGIHFQSSILGSRPIAGTAGRKWFTEDTFRLYYDDGSAWQEAGYVPLGGGTLTGNLLFSTDNTKDIGASGATRPRTGYFGTSYVAGTSTTVTVNGNSVTAAGGALAIIAPASFGVSFYPNNTLSWSFNSSGHFVAFADNTYDIGAVATNRPRNLYISGGIFSVGALSINGLQVVTTQRTGWTVATGTPTRTTFATSTVTLSVLAEHVKALIDDLNTHGLIGT